MKRILNGFFAVKRSCPLKTKVIERCVHEYNFDSDEEILENYLGNIMLIGINLPETKNLLTETAAEKLCDSFKKFNLNNEITVAVLHGCGGNFCTGIDSTENALRKSQELIELMSEFKKPIIASLDGNTINFGFQLAIMCDLKVMEETSLAGFGPKDQRTDALPVVYQRLVLTVGLSKAMEMVTSHWSWNSKLALEAGFTNRSVSCGAALGQAVLWGQSIALSPVEKIMEEKYKVLSCFWN